MVLTHIGGECRSFEGLVWFSGIEDSRGPSPEIGKSNPQLQFLGECSFWKIGGHIHIGLQSEDQCKWQYQHQVFLGPRPRQTLLPLFCLGWGKTLSVKSNELK